MGILCILKNNRKGSVTKMRYRNVFKEIGIPEKEISARLKEIVHTFFYDEEEKVYHPVGDDMAYIEDTGNIDARTEGMSYGCLLYTSDAADDV